MDFYSQVMNNLQKRAYEKDYGRYGGEMVEHSMNNPMIKYDTQVRSAQNYGEYANNVKNMLLNLAQKQDVGAGECSCGGYYGGFYDYEYDSDEVSMADFEGGAEWKELVKKHGVKKAKQIKDAEMKKPIAKKEVKKPMIKKIDKRRGCDQPSALQEYQGFLKQVKNDPAFAGASAVAIRNEAKKRYSEFSCKYKPIETKNKDLVCALPVEERLAKKVARPLPEIPKQIRKPLPPIPSAIMKAFNTVQGRKPLTEEELNFLRYMRGISKGEPKAIMPPQQPVIEEPDEDEEEEVDEDEEEIDEDLQEYTMSVLNQYRQGQITKKEAIKLLGDTVAFGRGGASKKSTKGTGKLTKKQKKKLEDELFPYGDDLIWKFACNPKTYVEPSYIKKGRTPLDYYQILRGEFDAVREGGKIPKGAKCIKKQAKTAKVKKFGRCEVFQLADGKKLMNKKGAKAIKDVEKAVKKAKIPEAEKKKVIIKEAEKIIEEVKKPMTKKCVSPAEKKKVIKQAEKKIDDIVQKVEQKMEKKKNKK